MNSTETQHSGDVFSCMLNIQHALKKHDTYKNNYQVMLQLMLLVILGHLIVPVI